MAIMRIQGIVEFPGESGYIVVAGGFAWNSSDVSGLHPGDEVEAELRGCYAPFESWNGEAPAIAAPVAVFRRVGQDCPTDRLSVFAGQVGAPVTRSALAALCGGRTPTRLEA